MTPEMAAGQIIWGSAGAVVFAAVAGGLLGWKSEGIGRDSDTRAAAAACVLVTALLAFKSVQGVSELYADSFISLVWTLFASTTLLFAWWVPYYIGDQLTGGRSTGRGKMVVIKDKKR